jgi:deoxycytidylate deaminase
MIRLAKQVDEKWHERFLDMARLVSTWSKHPEFQVGAIAIGDFGQLLAAGYNGWPRGITGEEQGRRLPNSKDPSSTSFLCSRALIVQRRLCRSV